MPSPPAEPVCIAVQGRIMWNSSRRIALFSTSLVLLGAGLSGAAWLAHWLPIEVGEAETGDLATQQTLEELDALDWSGFSDQRAGGDDSSEPGFVDSQQEPEFGAEPSSASFANTNEFVDRDRWIDDGYSADNARPNPSPARERQDAGSIPSQFPESEITQRPRHRSTDASGNPSGSADDLFRQAESGAMPQKRVIHQISAEELKSAPPSLFQTEEPPTFGESQGFPTEVALADESTTLDLFAPEESESSQESESSEAAPVFEQESTTADRQNEAAPVRTAARTVTSEPEGDDGAGQSTESKIQQIDQWLAERNFVAAHRELSTLYWNHPELKPVILERIEKNAETIYFSPQPHFLEPYEIQSGDFLQRIAPKYQINWEYLAALNRVDPRRIRAGQKLKVIKGPFSAFVDISDFELTVHCHGFFVKRYRIGTGRDGSTPVGKFAVLERITSPQYTDPNGRVIEGGDPANPLGTHWIDLGDSYGIHGTIEPDSIGKAESAGCVRMRNEDVVEVYNFLVKGSEVVIRP